MSVNSVVLIGNLAADPETFGSGCNLRLAVNNREKHNDAWEDRASFFTVTVFGKTAEACIKHLEKGSQVAVDGKLRQDRWEKDGQKRSSVKVVAFDVQFLQRSKAAPEAEQSKDSEDEIPF